MMVTLLCDGNRCLCGFQCCQTSLSAIGIARNYVSGVGAIEHRRREVRDVERVGALVHHPIRGGGHGPMTLSLATPMLSALSPRGPKVGHGFAS